METLIVVSKVKAHVRSEASNRVSEEAVAALSGFVGDLIKKAAEEAEHDGMTTIKARHVNTAIEKISGTKSRASDDEEPEDEPEEGEEPEEDEPPKKARGRR